MGCRIVQCANFVTPRSGGLRTAMHQLAIGYVDAGHHVVQVVPGRRDTVEETVWGTVHHVRAPVLPGSGYRVIAERRRLARLLNKLAPDRLEVHDRLTLRGLGLWARGNGVPALVVSHERLDRLVERWLPGGGQVRRATDASNRALAAHFDAVVCTTDWAAEEFRRISAANLVQIPLGVDLDTFTPDRYDADLRAQLVTEGETLLVSAVRLSPEKAPMRVVDTVRELVRRGRRVRLVVAGDGPLRGRLERAAVGLPITFLGFVTGRGELARLLACADAVIAPGPIETFGLAALEGLASGTPVVVDAAGALPEVIGAAGIAVRGTAADFADGVEALLTIPPGAARARARVRAECFPWSATTAAFLELHGLRVHGDPVRAGT